MYEIYSLNVLFALKILNINEIFILIFVFHISRKIHNGGQKVCKDLKKNKHKKMTNLKYDFHDKYCLHDEILLTYKKYNTSKIAKRLLYYYKICWKYARFKKMFSSRDVFHILL